MRAPRFPRRWFLAFAALLPVFGRGAQARTAAALAPAPGRGRELIALLPGRRDAAVIGREYLSAYPAESDLDALLRHFDEIAGHSNLRSAIAARLRKDFEDRDTVRLRGWILARTEARLCAICALLDADASA